MPSPPADSPARVTPTFPGVAGVAEAFRFVARGVSEVGGWAVYLPIVGVLVGGLWVGTDHWAEPVLGRKATAGLILLAAMAVHRGRPTLALARVLASATAGRDRRLSVIEAGGGPATLLWFGAVLAAESAALIVLDRFRLVGLAFAPLLGSCAMVVLAVGSRAARSDGRRLKFAPSVGFREFGVASAATFAVVFLSTEFLGLLLILTTAASTIGARVFFHRWIGGVSGSVMLAVGEAVQLAILAVLILLG